LPDADLENQKGRRQPSDWTSDMEAWTEKTGHQLVASEKEGDKFVFFIKRMK
jgi:TusA-related sulfurtransferase